MNIRQKLANAVANMTDEECIEFALAAEVYTHTYQPNTALMTAVEKLHEHGVLTEEEKSKSAAGQGLSV